MGVPGTASAGYQAAAKNCVNCHTPAEKVSLRRDPTCPARPDWPSYTHSKIFGIQEDPHWQQRNYLLALMQRGPRIDAAIDLGINGIPNSQATLTLGSYVVRPQKGSTLSAQVKTSSSTVPLEGKSFLDLEKVGVGPSWLSWGSDWWGPFNGLKNLFDNFLTKIFVSDGKLFIGEANGGIPFLRNPQPDQDDLTAVILSLLPVAYDKKTGELISSKREHYSLPKDLEAYHYIDPLHQMALSGRFPEKLSLTDLYIVARELQKASELRAGQEGPPPSPGPSALDAVISSLAVHLNLNPQLFSDQNLYVRFSNPTDAHGLHLDFQTQGLSAVQSLSALGNLNIEELFIPGILNLGKTRASVQMTGGNGNAFSIILDHLQSEIRPMDYGQDNPRKPGLVEVKEGGVFDGAPTTFQGMEFAPGIRFEILGDGDYLLTANLNIKLKASLPFLGEISFFSPFLFSKRIRTSSEQNLFQNSDLLALPHFKLEWGPQQTPFWVSGNALLTVPNTGGILANLEMNETNLGKFTRGHLEVLATRDRENPSGNLSFHSNLSLTRRDGTFVTGGISGYSSDHLGPSFESSLKISLDHLSAEGNILEPLIENGVLGFSIQTNTLQSPPLQTYTGQFTADSIWLDPLWEPIGVSSPVLRFSFSEIQNENGVKEWMGHEFQFSGNQVEQEVKRRGIFQGPFSIELSPHPKGVAFVSLNNSHHRADLKNLKIDFDFQKVVPPGLEKSFPKISSLDAEGRCFASWSTDTESWRGHGNITCRGTPEGDVFFRDLTGERMAAALDPEHRERLYELPPLSNSIFTIHRITGIDTKNEWFNGNFDLKSDIDSLVLKAMGYQLNSYGTVDLPFRELPYTPKGFEIRSNKAIISKKREKAARLTRGVP